MLGRFDKYLNEVGDDGICIVDNIPGGNQWKFLTDKFTRGLVMHGGKDERLERIKLYGTTCVGASHANSALDIALGTFRYCANNPANREACRLDDGTSLKADLGEAFAKRKEERP